MKNLTFTFQHPINASNLWRKVYVSLNYTAVPEHTGAKRDSKRDSKLDRVE